MNRNRLAFYAVLILAAAIFNCSTQLAMAAGNDNDRDKTFIGTSVTITNSGTDKWIVYAAMAGTFSSATNSMIITDDGSGMTRILVQEGVTNTLSYTDGFATVKWPKNATVTFAPSSTAVATNKYWFLAVSERPR